ncbi:thyroid adenoma-associated protein homolog [Tribolium madens]|uniref:thyroid adenoma-associated protein homolog n=1 Tax=Tribolium madens TaxID=41895 RepID=UPI001CF73DAC|nr:thyroid adenoma-associated protein homolog [Tribolium madens]
MAPITNLKFTTNYEICPENSTLSRLLNDLKSCNDDSIYKKLIDKILDTYDTHQDYHVRNVVIEAFTNTNARKNLLKYMYKKLNLRQIGQMTFFEHIVSSVTNECKENLDNFVFSVTLCDKVVHFFACCIQNFSHDFLEKTFLFYFYSLEAFTSQLSYGNDCLCMVLHQLAVTIPRANIKQLSNYALEMVVLTFEILQNYENFKFETILDSFVVFSYFSVQLPDNETVFLKHRNYPILDFIDNEKNDFCVILESKNFPNLFKTDRLKAILYLTISNTVPRDVLSLKISEKPLCESLYTTLIDLGMSLTNFPDPIVPISRTLDTLSKHIIHSSNFPHLFVQSFDFIWTHLDHFVDHVTQNTKSLLEKLTIEAQKRHRNGEKSPLEKLIVELNSLPTFGKVRLVACHVTSHVIDSHLFDSYFRNKLLMVAAATSDNIAALAYSNLMLQENCDEKIVQVWLKPVLGVLRMKQSKVLEDIITLAVRKKPTIFSILFTNLVTTSVECSIVLKCVRLARMTGSKFGREIDSTWRCLIPKKQLELFMCHHDDEIRIDALQVVAECQKSTEIFTDFELTFLIRYFRYNVSVSSANIRTRFVTYYKKVLRRFNVTWTKNPNTDYGVFLRHLLEILIINLSPDSNYSRRFISMELLLFIRNFYDWRNLFQADDIENLKHLILDGYESNKSLAVEILKSFEKLDFSDNFLQMLVAMLSDIRPNQSLSACYYFQLVQPEINVVAPLFDNIANLNDETPIYGIFQLIRYNPKAFTYTWEQYCQLCLKYGTAVLPIVANLAPEGYLPEESDITDTDQSSKSQKILVNSWKTMKEVMLLMADLVKKTIQNENTDNSLSEDFLRKIGDFFLDIFIQAKHRGVFEQAHVAFNTICQSFLASKNTNLSQLPSKWLTEAVCLCIGETIDDRLSPTRRSAGLPFLILSLLPNLTETSLEYLRSTLDSLLSISSDSPAELRIHCLNVLRFLFKDSKLGENIIVYVDRGAILALCNYKSRTWGVRNSATLLWSALVRRIFGVKETKMALTVFHARYPQLFEFLLHELQHECDKKESLVLEPILMVLGQLYPGCNETINTQVMKYLCYVEVCMKSSCLRTRDLAARASLALIGENLFQSRLDKSFERISRNLTDNECHGLLLQILHIFQSKDFDKLPITTYLEQSLHLLRRGESRVCHHLTVTLYMDMVFMLLSRSRDYKNLDLFKKIVELLSQMRTEGAYHEWSRFQLLLFIILNKFERCDNTYHIIGAMFEKYLTGNTQMRHKCLHFLIYLNQEVSRDRFKEHPLIVAGNVEICTQIKLLVHSFDSHTKKQLLTSLHAFLIRFFDTELRTKNDLILVLLLLEFYPCYFNTDRRLNTLEHLIAMATNDEVTSCVISVVKTILKKWQPDANFIGDFVKLLQESAAPAAPEWRRLAVAQCLVDVWKCLKVPPFEKYNLSNIILVLLEDDEPLVRQTMSLVGNTVSSPERSRELFLSSIAWELPPDFAINFLVSWSLRHLPEITRDVSDVYERGELNTHAENIPVAYAASDVLHGLVWNHDGSILLEERTLLVTRVVLNALIKLPSVMVDSGVKKTVICALRRILVFLEEGGSDFCRNFKLFFNTKILTFLRNRIKSDNYATVKCFFTYLYNPVLEVHFKFP